MAKSIKIFLIDGEPDGLKTAELSNWVGKAFIIPRNKIKEIKQRDECNKPAVYFLIGKENEEDLLTSVYIGEAENLWNRLFEHDFKKEFWQIAVAFVSKDDNLTKAHVRYLESRSLTIANEVKRFKLINGNVSSLPSLSEADIAEMEEFLGNLEMLLSALGYPILKRIIAKEKKVASDPIFVCQGKGAKATGRMTNEGFVVYSGSTATNNSSNAVVERNEKISRELLSNHYIEKQNNNLYTFVKDFVFKSPSAASDFILGNSTSGWEKWRTRENKTLKQIYVKA
jgi:hypothetical protein